MWGMMGQAAEAVPAAVTEAVLNQVPVKGPIGIITPPIPRSYRLSTGELIRWVLQKEARRSGGKKGALLIW